MKAQKSSINLHLWLALSTLILTANGWAEENLNLARAFGSHMVLQQGQPVPVWGTSKPEAKVTIALGIQNQTAIANSDGRWKTVFPSLKAKGQTLRLTAETAAGKITLDDILVGEVWLCAGQSNMEWKLSQSASAKTAIPAAKHARLRLFNFVGEARGGSGDYTPELAKRLTPQRFCSGQWRECLPDSAAPFSAVGYFFGQKLLADLNVPVGLINVAMGGTPAEAWVRRGALSAHPQLAAMTRGNWLENKSLEPWCRGRGASNLKRALAANYFIPGDDLGPNHSFKPAFMWDAAVAPLTQMPIAGVLWYQGESNARRAKEYEAIFPLLILDWRRQWQKELPYYFVQLANFRKPSTDPGTPDSWAELQNAQRLTLSLPKTGMAVINDIGTTNNIHPPNKQDVGKRLSLWALAKLYGKKDIVYSGPIFDKADASGEKRDNIQYSAAA